MASFSRKSGIVGALVIAGVLMVGAYIVSGPSLSFFTPVANAESTQALLQAYAQKDSDGDGLPDWEEALYGTDPHNAHSISAQYTDGQEVAMGLIKPKFSSSDIAASTTAEIDSNLPGIAATPGSLTDQFAQQFFGQYLDQQVQNAGGTPPSDSDLQSYAQSAMQAFIANQSHSPKFSSAQIKVENSDSKQALLNYAASADNVLSDNEVLTTENELDYFSNLIEKNDLTAIPHLSAIGKSYTNSANGFIQIPVPPEAELAQLEITNAMANLGEDITDMSAEQSDPLRAYLGLQRYETDAPELVKGLSDLSLIYVNENVAPPAGAAGTDFYRETLEAGIMQLGGTTTPSTASQ